MTTSGNCFVMQPFDDGGPFDSRYEQVLVPAIEAADLKAYRVDRDPSVQVPIEDIEEQIRLARACVADITTGNQNVAYELGFAMSLKKRVVLIGKKGTPLPFNFRHRRVTFYNTEAPKDFETFGKTVTEQLKSLLEKEAETAALQEVLAPTSGLKAHEIAALYAISQIIETPQDWAPVGGIRNVMEEMGYNRTATLVALAVLENEGLVKPDNTTSEYEERPFAIYFLTPAGLKWMLTNQGRLGLRISTEKKAKDPYGDIPF